MHLVTLLKKRTANGKNDKTVHQFTKNLVSMIHVRNTTMDLQRIVMVIKNHIAAFQTGNLINRAMIIISVIAKMYRLSKIFII